MTSARGRETIWHGSGNLALQFYVRRVPNCLHLLLTSVPRLAFDSAIDVARLPYFSFPLCSGRLVGSQPLSRMVCPHSASPWESSCLALAAHLSAKRQPTVAPIFCLIESLHCCGSALKLTSGLPRPGKRQRMLLAAYGV